MKRKLEEVTDDDIISRIIQNRENQIRKIEKEYFQLVRDLETFYPDQSQELCASLVPEYRKKLNSVLDEAEDRLKFGLSSVEPKKLRFFK